MKAVFKTLKWLSASVVILLVGFVIFVYARADRTYDVPYPDITASQDSALIARGRHLVFAPVHCAGLPRAEERDGTIGNGRGGGDLSKRVRGRLMSSFFRNVRIDDPPAPFEVDGGYRDRASERMPEISDTRSWIPHHTYLYPTHHLQ